jgi:hypothetical protein
VLKGLVTFFFVDWSRGLCRTLVNKFIYSEGTNLTLENLKKFAGT